MVVQKVQLNETMSYYKVGDLVEFMTGDGLETGYIGIVTSFKELERRRLDGRNAIVHVYWIFHPVGSAPGGVGWSIWLKQGQEDKCLKRLEAQ